MGRGKNGGPGAGFLKPLGGVVPARAPGAGAVFFLLGSALGFVAVLHASESEEAVDKWASAARRAAELLAGVVGAHHLLVAISLLFFAVSLLFLAASVWRLGRRCAAVEGLAGSADSAVQALRVGGVVCAVCGSKIQALKSGRRGAQHTRSDSSSGCPDKPVARSLAAEFEREAEKEEEGNAGETSDSEESNVQYLRRRLKEERLLKEVALEELEKERLATASAADEAMAKIACLHNEKALVEREVTLLRNLLQQQEAYDRSVIESLEWVIMRSGMQGWLPEAASSDPAVSETSEDDRDRK